MDIFVNIKKTNRTSDQLLQVRHESASRLIGEDLQTVDSFVGVEFHLYLFANPRSGGQKAKKYTQLGFVNC